MPDSRTLQMPIAGACAASTSPVARRGVLACCAGRPGEVHIHINAVIRHILIDVMSRAGSIPRLRGPQTPFSGVPGTCHASGYPRAAKRSPCATRPRQICRSRRTSEDARARARARQTPRCGPGRWMVTVCFGFVRRHVVWEEAPRRDPRPNLSERGARAAGTRQPPNAPKRPSATKAMRDFSRTDANATRDLNGLEFSQNYRTRIFLRRI